MTHSTDDSLAWIAHECARAGVPDEQISKLMGDAAQDTAMAEWELHKARAKQVLDNMRRSA